MTRVGTPFGPTVLKLVIAIDAVMVLVGISIYFQRVPSSIPLLGQLPPIAGLMMAVVFAIGIPATLIAQRRLRGTPRS